MAKKPDLTRGRPTADEEALFRAAMADAKPIEKRIPAPESNKKLTAATGYFAKPARGRQTTPLPPSGSSAPKPVLKVGKAVDLDRRTMDKLRKGRLRPEGRLDLHGMTANRALGALNEFLADAQKSGKRCVLVITGKGSMKEGGGVLRRELPLWLNTPGNRARVLGFVGSLPCDGGGGAFYVLLKRRR
ncbi:MAG: DNA mismatch repair protein MutS [Rhodospirillaceae bacterium]|nr:DNA mismatch repair protein MutS [Rhodospirillaceae bacterium]